MAATRSASPSGTPRAVKDVQPLGEAGQVPAGEQLGQAGGDGEHPAGEEVDGLWMSNGGRRLYSSHRVARSVSLRPSSSRARIWMATSTSPSSASTWAQKPGMSKTSRATSQAAVMSGTDAPVSSFIRNRKVIPDRSTMSLTTAVVMISRCSGWARPSGRRTSPAAAGEVVDQHPTQVGVVRQRRGQHLLGRAILVWASSTENSGTVRPGPADRRSAISLSPGSTSSCRRTRPVALQLADLSGCARAASARPAPGHAARARFCW